MSHTNQNTAHTFTSLFCVYLFIPPTNTQSQPLFFSSYIYYIYISKMFFYIEY